MIRPTFTNDKQLLHFLESRDARRTLTEEEILNFLRPRNLDEFDPIDDYAKPRNCFLLGLGLAGVVSLLCWWGLYELGKWAWRVIE